MLDNENVHGADELMKKLQQAQAYIDNNLPRIIGSEAVAHFKESFQNEGFTDNNLQKWAARDTKRKGSTNSQKILSKSGDLADSIDYKVEGNTITIHSDLDYAQPHNEGFNGDATIPTHNRKVNGKDQTVTEHTRKMNIPKRQFMGESKQLSEKLVDRITHDLTRILKE